MNLEQPCIRISVRNLVEFILRHGDIDNRTGGADKEAMQQGGRIHRKRRSLLRQSDAVGADGSDGNHPSPVAPDLYTGTQI